METTESKLKSLQLFYAAVLADAVRHFGRHGILDEVTETKRREQELAAPDQVARLGLASAEDIFQLYTGLFGCAAWTTEQDGNRLRAETRSCVLCALAKRMGAPAPCALYCINPLRAQAGALALPQKLAVEKTLWESDACVFVTSPAGKED